MARMVERLALAMGVAIAAAIFLVVALWCSAVVYAAYKSFWR